MEKQTDIVDKVEHAYFIILSLCRELYIRISNNHEKSESYQAMVIKLKKEMQFLDKTQLVLKAETIYAPLLKELMDEKNV